MSGRRALLSIVVPVLNEAENVAALLARLSALGERLDRDLEFVFVDDGSTDDSFALLRAARERDPRICVLRLSRNFGSHGACLAGFTHDMDSRGIAAGAPVIDERSGVIIGIHTRLNSKRNTMITMNEWLEATLRAEMQAQHSNAVEPQAPATDADAEARPN